MFGWLTGNSKIAEKAADGVYNGIDNLFFTEEEKSVASQKVLDFKIKYAEVTQSQSVARRIIAFGVTFMWCLVGIVALMAKAWGSDSFAEYAILFLKDVVMQPFMIIVGFYFLAHVVKGISSGNK